MNRLIEDFKAARKDLISNVDNFPVDKRGTTSFDKWSLKDILIHLTGWSEYQNKVLKDFKIGKQPISTSPQDLKISINENLVTKKEKFSWRHVYTEFIKISKGLIFQYESLTPEFWNKKIWKSKNTTPKDFIKIEINHYKKTHGPQIRKILKKLVNKLPN